MQIRTIMAMTRCPLRLTGNEKSMQILTYTAATH
jgi:hypothetical protein